MPSVIWCYLDVTQKCWIYIKAMINRMTEKIEECNDSGDDIVGIDEQPDDIIDCDVNNDPVVVQRQNEKKIKN